MSNYDTKTIAIAAGVAAVVSAISYAVLRKPSDSKLVVKSNIIKRIALTGGPCGGKSSSLKHFTKELEARGIDVYAVPEIPTIMISGGCQYPGTEEKKLDELYEFETALLNLQVQIEDSFTRVAVSTGRPSVIVMDRGLLDVPAYLPAHLWQGILTKNGWTEAGFAARYDMVLHLVTAADGAEAFYTTSNNAARTETAEQARVLDKKMQGCWRAHKSLKVVKNEEAGFKAKLETASGFVHELTKDLV